MLGIVLPIWAWLVFFVIAGIVALVQKASQATERQRVSSAHRAMDANRNATQLPPPNAPPGATTASQGPELAPPTQDW